MKTIEVLERVLAGKRVGERTKDNYRLAFRRLGEFTEEFPEDSVVVNEWLGSLTGYADTTVRLWFALVKSAGKYMEKASGRNVDGSWKMPNPCDDAEVPVVKKKRRRYFTAEEVVRIIRACRFEQDKVVILTLIDSACRVGELVGLRSGNVGDSWIDVHGKTGERRYRLDVNLCMKLRELGGESGVIFADMKGGDASVDSLKSRVRRVIKEAGITGGKVGAHTLRHSAASLVAEETGSALVVKALLQHDKIDTSMEYIHDVEDKIAQGISPLHLFSEKVFGDGRVPESRQLTMGEPAVEGEFSVVESEAGPVESMMEVEFRQVVVGTKVRSTLGYEELVLIRKAFIRFCDDGATGEEIMRCRELFRRMLRKVKRDERI